MLNKLQGFIEIMVVVMTILVIIMSAKLYDHFIKIFHK